MSLSKTTVYRYYQEMLRDRLLTLQANMDALRESLQQETKSTAGDKYETARAMLHMEQEQLAQQLATLQQQKALLDSLDTGIALKRAGPGSLVQTNKGYFFIGIALGKATIEGQTVFAISALSPLGKLLMGIEAGQDVVMKETAYRVEGIQ